MSKNERKPPKRRSFMFVYDGVQVLDVAGTAQALTTANEEGAAPHAPLRSDGGSRHDCVWFRDHGGAAATLRNS